MGSPELAQYADFYADITRRFRLTSRSNEARIAADLLEAWHDGTLGRWAGNDRSRR
jgi:hypothetical protein